MAVDDAELLLFVHALTGPGVRVRFVQRFNERVLSLAFALNGGCPELSWSRLL